MPLMPQGDWSVVPYVSRPQIVRLKHNEPHTINGYVCSWPNGAEEATDRLEANIINLTLGADGTHTGKLMLIVYPGQDPSGEIRCNARRLTPHFDTLQETITWHEENPELQQEWLISGDSNPLLLGEILPNPVPEPSFFVGLVVGLLLLIALTRRALRAPNHAQRRSTTLGHWWWKRQHTLQ